MKARLPLVLALASGVTRLALTPSAVAAAVQPQGDEYALTSLLRGDQVFPRAALNVTGGYLVWQDNAADGDGAGIRGARVGSGLSPAQEVFNVNVTSAGDQEKPDVALLDGGGAAFVWQSENTIRARVLNPAGVFTTAEDIIVNSHQGTLKVNPVVCGLKNGGALVVWASFGQDDAGSLAAGGGYANLQGVYARQLDAAGALVGDEILVNQQVQFSQRNPAIARLSSGNLVVVWISERGAVTITDGQLTDAISGVEVTGRMFSPSGQPAGSEFLISPRATLSATPSVSPSGDGFAVTWAQGDPDSREVGFDIWVRAYEASGLPTSSPARVNTTEYGDQFAPSIASAGGTDLIVWTSLAQDGSREGVFGRFIAGGTPQGPEFRVNTTVVNRQMHPRAAARGTGSFLALWSGYVGSPRDFEIFGQRYALTLPEAPTPMVSALSANRLSLAWPPVGGYSSVDYLVYMDGASDPAVVSGVQWNTPANLQPGSTHAFRLAFRLPDGSVSPQSPTVSGTTWGADENFDGLPDDWQARYWGAASGSWPAGNVDSDQDGMSNRDEFLAGTDPSDASKVLRVGVRQTGQGTAVRWNTTPGQVYQLQTSEDLKTWNSMGQSRFARAEVDQVLVEPPAGVRYYRVIRLR